jgi:succinate dehydrogenase hydrophobic anchor subunit
MSRFASSGTVRASLDIYTAVSGIALLVMILGCLYLVFHNMEFGSAQAGQQVESPFEILQ